MLSRILSALPDGNRKFPLRYMRMINSISDRMWLARNRYLLAHPIHTPGVEFLRYLCLNLDITALDEFQNDEDRYTEIIKFFKDPYRTAIDPVYSNNIAGGKFVYHNGGIPPCELFLNCESADPLRELPFDKDWNEWKGLRALRLQYHDSMELPEDFAKSMFMFKEQMPTYLTFSLDVPILLFKYYKYTVECRDSHLDVNTNAFLKEYELTHFFDDIFDVWILNLLTRVFSDPSASADDIIKDITMPIRFCTTNMLRQSIEGIQEFVTLLKSGALRPQDFMEIKWFRERSLKEVIEDIERWVRLPPTHRYMWLNTALWLPYLSLVLLIVHQFPDGPMKDTVDIRCKEVWNMKFRTAMMPSAVVVPSVGNFVRELQDTVYQLLMGKDVILPKAKKTT